MSSKTDFEMYAGDTRDLVVTLTDQDGVAVDVTTGSVLWRLATKNWQSVDDPSAVLISKTSVTGQITLDVGKFTVHLLSPDTEGLEGSFYHEAQVTLDDGTVGTPLVGSARIKANLIEPR
jgi:hypothetical protein